MTGCKRSVFHRWQRWTIFSRHHWRCYFVILAKRIPLPSFHKSALDNSAAGVETARKILELVTRFGKVVQFQCEDIQPGYMFQKNSKSLDSAKVAEMQKGWHSLLCRAKPSVCRHFLQGWHWCFVPCWCGWHRQHVEGAEESAEDEWCSCQGRFAWGLASEWIKRCRPAAKLSQNAAWWSRPTACLAAHRLKPKAGEAARDSKREKQKMSARSTLGRRPYLSFLPFCIRFPPICI